MRDGWDEVALGDLFEATNQRLGLRTEEPDVFSVTKYDGVVRASEYFDKRIASAKLDSYKVLEPNEWAYSTIHIDEGSIARNRLGVSGVVSPMYTTMRLKSARVLPYFCELVLRSPRMLALYGAVQQGSINRRRSLPWKVFCAMTIPLPPLPDQRRIVDLIEALDDAIAAAEKSLNVSRQAARQIRQVAFSRATDEAQSVSAGAMFDMLLGRQKSARQSTGEHVIPYLRAANLSSDGFLLDDVQTMNFTPVEQDRYCIRTGDVMLIEGGATLGRSSMWKADVEGPVGFDKHMIRLRAVRGRSLPEYALQWTKWAYESGAFDAVATGITIRALGFGRASGMPVPDLLAPPAA